MNKLAIENGEQISSNPLPARGLIGEEEKAAAMALFDESIASGEAFGYNGKQEQGYEQAFVDYMGGGFADGVNSGTNAVFCALGGLQMDAFSEVVVPPITDPGGVMPVLFVGCVPVFADAAPGCYNTSAEQIEKVVTERTRAILVAHIAGDPLDMDPIMELAKKHKLYVVEDCAQAHGAEYKGRKVGSIGDIAAFSTMLGKHHCTGGQGGVVYTTNEKLHWQARRFADRGKPFNVEGETDNVTAGINCNLNDLAAAIGIEQLKKLPGTLEKRRKVANLINGGIGDCKAVSPGTVTAGSSSARWFLRFKLELDAISVGRDQFCKALEAELNQFHVIPSYRHIQCEKRWFKNQSVFGKSGFPWQCMEYKGDRSPTFEMTNAIDVTDTHFNFLIYESYGEQEANNIVAAIKKVEATYLK